MKFFNNDRLQEWLLILDDNLSHLNRRWLYSLAVVVVLILPLFFLLRFSFFKLQTDNYFGPVIMRPSGEAAPLTVLDKKIFALGPDLYSGFVKIKNINLERGVPEFLYSVEFKTLGGTSITKVSGKTFILPASEKILVISRIRSAQKPEVMEFRFDSPRFVYKPQMPTINIEVQRVEFDPSQSSLNAAIKNLSAFTLGQVYLTALLYDKDNNIIAVNSTVVNEVKSAETRSFRFNWPNKISGAARAEIFPEVDIFDRNLLSAQLFQEQQ